MTPSAVPTYMASGPYVGSVGAVIDSVPVQRVDPSAGSIARIWPKPSMANSVPPASERPVSGGWMAVSVHRSTPDPMSRACSRPSSLVT